MQRQLRAECLQHAGSSRRFCAVSFVGIEDARMMREISKHTISRVIKKELSHPCTDGYQALTAILKPGVTGSSPVGIATDISCFLSRAVQACSGSPQGCAPSRMRLCLLGGRADRRKLACCHGLPCKQQPRAVPTIEVVGNGTIATGHPC